MKNKKPDKKEIENKLNLVIDKLMNLGKPDNDEELEKGGRQASLKGTLELRSGTGHRELDYMVCSR